MSEEKYLKIASMLMGGSGASSITSSLKVSGRDVGKAKRLMEEGLITLDGEGKPFYTRSFEEVEGFLAGGKGSMRVERKRGGGSRAGATAEGSVERVFQSEVASEARNRTSQYLIVGKMVSRALRRYAQNKGIPIEEFVEMSGEELGSTVVEAMDYVLKAKRIEERKGSKMTERPAITHQALASCERVSRLNL